MALRMWIAIVPLVCLSLVQPAAGVSPHASASIAGRVVVGGEPASGLVVGLVREEDTSRGERP